MPLQRYRFLWLAATTSVVALATIPSIVSVVTPSWYVYTFAIPGGTGEIVFGLWKYCMSVDITAFHLCTDNLTYLQDFFPRAEVDTISRVLNAIRGIAVGSIVLAPITASLAVWSTLKSSICLTVSAAAVSTLQGIAMATALVLYLVSIIRISHHPSGLSWSFGVGWIGVAFHIIAVIAFIIQAVRLRYLKRDYIPLVSFPVSY